MTNNSMAISVSQNSFTSDSDSTSSWDNHFNSSSPRPHHPPPPVIANQPQENLLLTTPPAKKPRGRPPGSKNKPKITSLLMAQPMEPSMEVVIVNVDPGRDIMETILAVAHRSHVSVTVLSAFGTVTRVTIRNSPHGVGPLTLHGPFTLLSLNGSHLYNNHYTLHPGATPPPPLSFGIHLSTSQGHVINGVISGKVMAGDGVILTLSTFRNPEIFKYVPEDEEGDHDRNENNNNNYNNNPSDLSGGGGNLLGFNMVGYGIHGW